MKTGAGAPADRKGSKGAPPPPEVGVVTVDTGTVGLVTELPGRTEASRIAQVRARAAGILQQRLFREGSDVKAGQVLFQIDAAPYRALLAAAQAAVARGEANVMQTRAQAERYKPLAEANAISQQDYVNAVAAQRLAEAELAASHASLQTAQINLGYASVTAPIAGRIGRALVTEGALVGQSESTPLAVVQQIDPIYVNILQPVADVLRLRAAIARGELRRAGAEEAVPVRLVLEDGTVYPVAGRLLFSDLSVDAATGQIALRAEVANPRGVLLPGMYVRARLEQASAASAILLPQQGVQRAAQGDSVKVVAADGKVSDRPVKLGPARNGQWVVLEGLKAGEQVVVDGFQKLQGDRPVKAVPWQAPGSTPAGAAAPPGAPSPARAQGS
ncbi:MAG: efflux RND transporter periplasmic adaptor subunit [Rhodocyclaceae bacterium]|nr:efflux RND transporter periplasmic adaptor subunit [Rhodocyclaceae bacterium]MCA3074141.1 efflux RND transporter periplasmic adaptor subunit [Rhodocyclaceae bacterium]MCA3092382.1 efflux RND transporter periplasmic adaptor subunit [Rhodocyclaceae bacterium]MCA3097214.1 efflux RND transporter periplasmic adaptor subunit [Rhodocyclaceae bacterium]MCA3103877.1 efflux RND transporter periplasmic adaptor subunit [Rhodocyclaceae bacterium]